MLVGRDVPADHFERLRAAFPRVERHPCVEPGAIVAVDLPPLALDLGPMRFDEPRYDPTPAFRAGRRWWNR